MDKTINILFCGTGGQGVLKAAEVCGWAAVLAGFHVKKSEVHGMAQRGGSVESHLRFGKQVFSPLIPKGECDILVPFHSGEEERSRLFLKPGGINLHDRLIQAYHQKVEGLFLNTYMLGALAASLDIPKDCWIKALEQEFQNRRLDDNIKTFNKGLSEVRP